ncbi:hypothetical protein [Streptomyces scabiei]|nr:hypothetical protein [Streptomyces scabiei]MDX3266616.1 hypothetical protein [Streptomyces scabiei]
MSLDSPSARLRNAMLFSTLLNPGANSSTRNTTTPIPGNSAGLLQFVAFQCLTAKQQPYAP